MEPLAQLANIYSDEETALRRRVEAAALVLQHAASEELVADASEFLIAVSKADEALPDCRIEAIKALAKRQVPKAASPGTAGNNPAAFREAWIRQISADRRSELRELGLWPAPEGWADDLKSPDWVPPEGNPPGYPPRTDFTGMGEELRAARLELMAERKRSGNGGNENGGQR